MLKVIPRSASALMDRTKSVVFTTGTLGLGMGIGECCKSSIDFTVLVMNPNWNFLTGLLIVEVCSGSQDFCAQSYKGYTLTGIARGQGGHVLTYNCVRKIFR